MLFGGNDFVSSSISLFFGGISLNCSGVALIYFRSPHCAILPFLPSSSDGILKIQMSNFGRSFSTVCIWFLWQAQQALELFGFGVMARLPVDCVWTSFPSVCNVLLSHYAVECFCLMCLNLPGILHLCPFMAIKLTFFNPMHDHLSFPAACTAAVSSYMCSILACILHQ